MSEREKEMEAVLLEYVERYGLTSKARRFFGAKEVGEKSELCPGSEELRMEGMLIRDSLIVLRERASSRGCLATNDALRIAIMRLCIEFDIPTTLPVADLAMGFKVMVPQTVEQARPNSH